MLAATQPLGNAGRAPRCRPPTGMSRTKTGRGLLCFEPPTVGTTWEQLRPNTRENGGVGPTESRTNQQDRRPGPVCKTSIPGSNPGGASNLRAQIRRRLPARARRWAARMSQRFGWQAQKFFVIFRTIRARLQLICNYGPPAPRWEPVGAEARCIHRRFRMSAHFGWSRSAACTASSNRWK